MCDHAKKLRAIAESITDAAAVAVLHDVADHLDWADNGVADLPEAI